MMAALLGIPIGDYTTFKQWCDDTTTFSLVATQRLLSEPSRVR
jgi:hypothetical protein